MEEVVNEGFSLDEELDELGIQQEEDKLNTSNMEENMCNDSIANHSIDNLIHGGMLIFK